MDDRHPIDQWDDTAKKATQDANAEVLRQYSLIYSVFDSEHGKKLLDSWTNGLIDVPSARVGYDLLTIGLAEGKKDFVRSILHAIKTIEETQ